ncbi:MAG TPA: glycosyltransferase family 39 protein [Isosphaeraceae bacterium]|jgi:4-amino-4-deoxy-L-arabinose transferase-like glycosyltransferase|nr:glycosyltransferase family 39 protein [Isosphaeraceae bacterium]
MAEDRLGWRGVVAVAATAAACVGPWGPGRLSYHEAIWAQSARELLARGDWLVPTLDGRPWLEKPPLATWLIALTGLAFGRVDEVAARVPSAVAAVGLALGVATLAARRFGARIGRLAGLVQATTAWCVLRGRLAEVDLELAALVTWALVAFDWLRRRRHAPRAVGHPTVAGMLRVPSANTQERYGEADGTRSVPATKVAFFTLLGLMSLAKGVGFGAVLVAATVLVTILWDRDWRNLRALLWLPGWLLAAIVTIAWPMLVAWRHPNALSLWTLHVADRLAARPEHFAGERPWEYAIAPLWQGLPWTPLALAGAWRSWPRARADRGGVDRLLWAWAVVPAALVSLATVRNGHYLIYSLPPWSLWSAGALDRLGDRMLSKGWSVSRWRRIVSIGMGFLAASYAVGLGWVGPALERRGAEWAFYEEAGRRLGQGESLAIVYDDWDRKPYPSPFGPMPHDLAVRLYYLRRPASWREGVDDLRARPPCPADRPFAVIARERDVPALRGLGRVEVVARGPSSRWDRVFALYRVRPGAVRRAR